MWLSTSQQKLSRCLSTHTVQPQQFYHAKLTASISKLQSPVRQAVRVTSPSSSPAGGELEQTLLGPPQAPAPGDPGPTNRCRDRRAAAAKGPKPRRRPAPVPAPAPAPYLPTCRERAACLRLARASCLGARGGRPGNRHPCPGGGSSRCPDPASGPDSRGVPPRPPAPVPFPPNGLCEELHSSWKGSERERKTTKRSPFRGTC